MINWGPVRTVEREDQNFRFPTAAAGMLIKPKFPNGPMQVGDDAVWKREYMKGMENVKSPEARVGQNQGM